jgi:hypothetical protein
VGKVWWKGLCVAASGVGEAEIKKGIWLTYHLGSTVGKVIWTSLQGGYIGTIYYRVRFGSVQETLAAPAFRPQAINL